MLNLSYGELIETLNKRIEDSNKALHDLGIMTGKLEEVNKKLQESEALKSNFLSNIRNEINNPLTSIMGLSNEIRSAKTENIETLSAVAALIYTEAFNLDFQLQNIFAAAEIEAGEAAPAICRVDIERLVAGVADSLRHAAEEKRTAIHLDCACEAEEDRYFRTDPGKLKIIIANLISNAIKFGGSDSDVGVEVLRKGANLGILVEDRGIGVEEKEQQRIFERFRQLDMGVSKNYRGHGLGLSVTKALVELLGGTITFASAKGKGATFIVSLPESAAEIGDCFSDSGNEFIFEDGEKF